MIDSHQLDRRGRGYAIGMDPTDRAGGVRPRRRVACPLSENDRLFQRPEAGLSQQNRAVATRRPFDNRLWCNAALRRSGLDGIDI